MVASILVGVAAFLLLVGLIVLIYRNVRTYDANPNQTYIVQHKGEIAGALREPATLWSPSMSILRDKKAPTISFPAKKEKSGEIYSRSLVEKQTGRVSLSVNTCSPPNFNSVTVDGHVLDISAHVVFRIDIERIHIPSQLDNFGATLANRIENLFDNEITRLKDEEVRANQAEIEGRVTSALREIELSNDDQLLSGMPLGIKVYEASFSFRDPLNDPVSDASGAMSEGKPLGPVWLDAARIDKLADVLTDRSPEVRDAVMRIVELQTRQNIVEMICKSGGLVAFTAKELGLNDLVGDQTLDGLGGNHLANKAAAADLSAATVTPPEEAGPAVQNAPVAKDYYGRPVKPKQA